MIPVAEQLEAGLELMVLGMGVVFVLLGLLVVAVGAMSRFARAFEARHPAALTPTAAIPPAAVTDLELIAAIGAAIHSYRRRHRR